MKINDARFKKEELLWDDLEMGKVYVSSQKQKYVMHVHIEQDVYMNICLEGGEAYDWEDHLGDRFTLVDAVLEIR